MSGSWVLRQVVHLLVLTEWTLSGGVAASGLAGRGARAAASAAPRPAPTTAAPGMQRPAGIPHMWSERQHSQLHKQDGGHAAKHDHEHGQGAPEPTGEADTVTYDHVQEGASHRGKPALTRPVSHRKGARTSFKHQLHRMGGINDILKRPGVDPEITGDANLNLLSVMRLASLNFTQLGDDDDAGTGSGNVTERQLRRKLRRRLSSSTKELRTQHKHGRSRYSLVTTRVRTRAKRSDGDMSDDYTWAVIVGGSGLAILIVVMCACVCARCNVDRKGTEASTPLPTEPPTPAVFFVGGNNSADTGVDNSGFAMGDLPLGGGTDVGAAMGPSTSGFGYSALKDDEDCVSLRSATWEVEKS